MAKQRIRGLGLRGGARIPQRGLGEIDRERALAGQSLNVLGSAIQSAISLGGGLVAKQVQESREKRFFADVSRGRGEINLILSEATSGLSDANVTDPKELELRIEEYQKAVPEIEGRIRDVISGLDSEKARDILTNKIVNEALPTFQSELTQNLSNRLALLGRLQAGQEYDELLNEPVSDIEDLLENIDLAANLAVEVSGGESTVEIERARAGQVFGRRLVERLISEGEPYEAFKVTKDERFQKAAGDTLFSLKNKAKSAVLGRAAQITKDAQVRYNDFTARAKSLGLTGIQTLRGQLSVLQDATQEIVDNQEIIQEANNGFMPPSDLGPARAAIGMDLLQYELGMNKLQGANLSTPLSDSEKQALASAFPDWLAAGDAASKLLKSQTLVQQVPEIQNVAGSYIASVLNNPDLADLADDVVNVVSEVGPHVYGLEPGSDEARMIGLWDLLKPNFPGDTARLRESVVDRLASREDPARKNRESLFKKNENWFMDRFKKKFDVDSVGDRSERWGQWKELVIDNMHLNLATKEQAVNWASDLMFKATFSDPEDLSLGENVPYMVYGDPDNNFVGDDVNRLLAERSNFDGEWDDNDKVRRVVIEDPDTGRNVLMFMKHEKGIPVDYVRLKGGDRFFEYFAPEQLMPLPVSPNDIQQMTPDGGMPVFQDAPLNELKRQARKTIQQKYGNLQPYPNVVAAFPELEGAEKRSRGLYARLLPSVPGGATVGAEEFPDPRTVENRLRRGMLDPNSFSDEDERRYAATLVELYENTQVFKAILQNTMNRPLTADGRAVKMGKDMEGLPLELQYIDEVGVDFWLNRISEIELRLRNSPYYRRRVSKESDRRSGVKATTGKDD